MKTENIEHWENIYKNKHPDEVSWTQNFPKVSVDLFEECALSKNSFLADIGCGEEGLIPYWLKSGFENITALDISTYAIEKLKSKITNYPQKVIFENKSVLNFKPQHKIDFWHDRAVFHFLTDTLEIEAYINLVSSNVSQFFCIGTFAESGPEKCSGLPIKRYTIEQLTALFSSDFSLIRGQESIHLTPFGTEQAFVYCLFKRKSE